MTPGTPKVSSEDNGYVGTTVHCAWTYTFCRKWANARLISLSRIQEHIKRETHVPVTLEMLLHAEPQQTKYQKRSWWSNVESVFRCVARYHQAVGASEHDKCRSIETDIGEYAHTLRQGLPSSVDVTQFLMLLHQGIRNRALHMALQKTLDQSPFRDDLLVGPGGRRMGQDYQRRQAFADLLDQCLDVVEQDYQKLRTDMRQFSAD